MWYNIYKGWIDDMKPVVELKYNSKLLKLCYSLLLLYTILLGVVIFTKQSIGVVIVLSVLFIMLILVTFYLAKHRIIVYSDKLVIIGIFASKEFLYENCIIEEDVSIRIFNNDYNEQIRIGSFLDKKSIILKSYREYCKRNKKEQLKINNVIKYNYYVRNFSLFGIVFSIILFLLAGLVLYLYVENIYQDFMMFLFFLILGVVINVISLIGILNYNNFRISIDEDQVVSYNMFKCKSTYRTDEITFEDAEKFIILYLGENKKKKLLYYFLDNSDVLYQLLKMKQENQS